METLSRRPIQLLKQKDNTVIALCEDGSIWVARINYSSGNAYSTPCMWKRVNDIPGSEESQEAA